MGVECLRPVNQLRVAKCTVRLVQPPVGSDTESAQPADTWNYFQT